MRINFVLFVLVASCHFFHLKAQYSTELSIGVSNYLAENKNMNNKTLFTYEPILAWRVIASHEFSKDKTKGSIGLSFYLVGAQTDLPLKWDNVYLGIRLEIGQQIKRFRLSISSTPSIRLASSLQVGSQGGGLSNRKKMKHYLFDVEPSISYRITQHFSSRISFSLGLNNAIKLSASEKYKIHAGYLGLQYYF